MLVTFDSIYTNQLHHKIPLKGSNVMLEILINILLYSLVLKQNQINFLFSVCLCNVYR